MKILVVYVSIISLGVVVTSPVEPTKNLRGSCENGPTYWCKNFENARNCHATKNCIQTVWQHMSIPEDNDSVCQICLDMVKQAREQLESNQTQDDLRAVFEGSCKLIYVKPIIKECIKVVDDFIPELIEALASQMNPQVVCSVAGLCNNVKIDQMIENYETEKQSNTNKLSCESCGNIASVLTNKFHKTSRDDFLENILQICGKLSSFSDACANIVITHFNELHEFFMTNLNPNAVCHIGGVCTHKFHNHLEKEIEITPMSNVGFVKTTSDPDIPCELCEQLVNHLRDMLIANTTEAEFKQVLEGLCGQTKSFKQECMAIVSQYYENIYEFLIKSLSPNDACFYIGICPKDFEAKKISVIAPIVSIDVQLPSYNHTKKSGDDELELKKRKEINQSKFSREQYFDPKKVVLGFDEPFLTAEEILAAQLPIDRLMGAQNNKALSEGGAWCTMCEYILHFVQEELSDANNEEQIKRTVLSTCGKMPKSIAPECRNFVELYGDAIIALLIQEVDPATVCPQLKICPSNIGRETEVFAPNTVEIQAHSEASKRASCPLCLLAVEQAQQVIQNDKTIGRIKQVLEQLCSHLNNKLKMECSDFIETYSKELIDLLMKDFTPQEICVYLNLCSDKRPDLSNFGISMVIKNNKEQELTTNEIWDNTIDGIMISSNPTLELHSTPECLLCQEIVKQVEKNVVDKNSKIEIKKALEKACMKVPKKARSKCEDYVEKHGDQIAELIVEELSPKEICRDIQLCVVELGRSHIDHVDIEDAIHVTVFANVKSSSHADRQTSDLLKSSQTCILCEMIVSRMEKYLEKTATQEQVQDYLDHVCDILPSTIKSECVGFINTYSTLILQTFESIPPKKICEQINLCSITKIKSKDEIVECAVCEGSVASLGSLLQNKNVDEKIEYLLEQSCQSVPSRFYEKCKKMVETYGISMIEQLKEHPESHNVCADIGMCYRDQTAGFVNMQEFSKMKEQEVVTEKHFLVGENECTWGPSHWCKDEETAKKCSSIDFCKQKLIGMWSV